MKKLLLASLLLAAACGSKSSTGATTGGAEPAPGPTGPLEAGQWETLDDTQRAGFMKNVVLPHMTNVLAEFPDEFNAADITCETCHGSGAAKGEFHMPNPELPTLTPAAVQSPDDDHKAIVEFMAQRVTPEMATLLGKPTWSPENPEGFGCGGCHPFQQQ